MTALRMLLVGFVSSACVLYAGVSAADEDDLAAAARAAFDAVEMTKYERTGSDELTSSERARLQRNFERQVSRHFDDDMEPDADARHFTKSSEDYFDSEEYWKHVEGCPVCNPYLRSLLRGTGIKPIPFIQPDTCPPIATVCHTPRGSCAMSQRGPVQYQCFCPTAYGPVWGVSGC